MSGNDNPGNFANRPTEEVQEIASKGGQASHSGGFASMDPDKQVCARRITTERTIN
jgi:general stress protein YciG